MPIEINKGPDLFDGALPTYTTQSGEVVEHKPRGKYYVAPRGGADRPGTGPEGETCKTCKHIVQTGREGKRFYKCALNRACWTHGGKTDIRVRWAACSKWERPEPEVKT